MWKGLPSPAARYGVAVLAVALVFLIKVLLNPLLEQGSPFLLVFWFLTTIGRYGRDRPYSPWSR